MIKTTIGGWLLALALAPPAGAATLELERLVAAVTVVPEDRTDVQVTVLKTNPKLPIYVRRAGGGSMVVAGQPPSIAWLPFWGARAVNCPEGEPPVTYIWGHPPIAAAELPQIVARVPRRVEIRSSGSVLGVVGRSEALKLAIAGCDHWALGDVRGPLALNYAGSGRVRAGSAESADVLIAGSGNVDMGVVRNGLKVAILGSGNVNADRASGPIQAFIAGSGGLAARSGRASYVHARIAGSGDINYAGLADAVDAGIAGSGNIAVAKVAGPVRKTVSGSGRVTIGP
jgi:hypothetical protein